MSSKEVVGEVMLTEKEIRKRAEEIGEQIDKDYNGEGVILVGILKGAVVWMGDIMKSIKKSDVEIDFMACSSYGSATKSSGVVKINKDLDCDIKGKNVIIVEDIVDSGITLKYLKGYLQNRQPKSIKICCMLDKPTGRRTELEADYAGFEVDDLFIVGYGLDIDQKYRQLPYISYINS